MIKTTYLQNKTSEHNTGKTAYTKPTNTYLALLTDDPTDAGITSGKEVAGGSYARQQITWGSANAGLIQNSAQIQFTNMPTTAIRYWAIMDASSSGNMLYYAKLPVDYLVTSGNTVTVAVGNLGIKEN